MILGITGLYCSGKDTAANHLVTKGFLHISLSDIIREQMQRRGRPVTRESMILFGNELRELFGAGILAERALQRMEPGKNYAVSSIRNPAEVALLRQRPDFMLIEVQAPAKLRFGRMKRRRRENDPATYGEFTARERQEQSASANEQQLHKVAALAKIKVANNGAFGQLYRKLDRLLADWKPRLSHRPSWDEYFLGVSREVAKRATCDRGRSGCVIVKDKRILTTGYVGSPVGVEHCDEIGHQMHAVVNADGSISQHCIRTTHAEQNALVQAARYGIPIDSATLYVKMEPCYVCAKMIVNAGIRRVVCEKRYHGAQLSRELFRQAGVQLEVLYDELEQYANQ